MRNPNSKARADLGEPYEQIPRPKDDADAIDAIDIWARYVHQWGARVGSEFHDHYVKLRAAAAPTSHLDPPPEPFDN